MRILKSSSDATTLQEPLSSITDTFVIIVIVIIIDTVFVVSFTNVFTVTNLLGSLGKDQDIQDRIKRKTKKCSNQDKAGDPSHIIKWTNLLGPLGKVWDIHRRIKRKTKKCSDQDRAVDRSFHFGAKHSQNLEKLE
ncbi:PREDICTED: uncharacterized protein LOC107348001 [Acropora digitifera]|uniref:uncharacterized protein LOC107348001 n=1 Tax=Acropora digitifera TaxID=70779 RepID=UPI00077A6CF6|nr:PREDICTED: uncharacterized protein LOC107348001 [Acropora digitifera]